jgi:prevent-host-death family protein
MQMIAIHQAKSNFSALLHAVELGDEVVLTRHGKPIARIVAEPASDVDARLLISKAEQAQQQLDMIRAKVKPGQAMDWKTARDAGRK